MLVKKGIRAGISLLLFLCFFISSCAVQSIVIKPGYDFTKIKRVAVLDFKDAAYYPNSGSMASELFVKYLLKTGYNVIERAELDSILKEYQLSAQGIIDRSQTKEFGKIAGVDAIITGSIPTAVPERDYYENGNIRYIAAQVGLTCRMISVETGEVLWAGSNTFDAMNMQTAFEYLVSSLVDQLMKDLKKN
jgi:curli biogenesis system outer membrane secretion channel CsgG